MVVLAAEATATGAAHLFLIADNTIVRRYNDEVIDHPGCGIRA